MYAIVWGKGTHGQDASHTSASDICLFFRSPHLSFAVTWWVDSFPGEEVNLTLMSPTSRDWLPWCCIIFLSA